VNARRVAERDLPGPVRIAEGCAKAAGMIVSRSPCGDRHTTLLVDEPGDALATVLRDAGFRRIVGGRWAWCSCGTAPL
jgi:hypothetical protein